MSEDQPTYGSPKKKSREEETNFEIHYNEIFKGKKYHIIICVCDWQLQGAISKLKNRQEITDLDVQLRMEEDF